MATDFDKEFDEAPEATFDDEFEAAPEISQPSMLDKILQRGQEYLEPAMDVGQGAIESAQDFSTGVAKGLTMGALDELGGLAGATVEKGLGALGIGPAAVEEEVARRLGTEPESFLESYRGYQQASEQAQKESAERSPVLDVAGQIAGGITSGALLGSALGVGKAAQGAKSLSDIARNEGKAKAALELLTRGTKGYAKAAPAIAAESALTSEEQLLGPESNIPGVAADVAGGLAFGFPAMLGLQATTELAVPSVSKKAGEVTQKIKEAFQSEDHPRLRQMAQSFTEYGRNIGIHPRSHGADISAGGQAFAQRDPKATMGVLSTLEEADDALGAKVGEALEQATERGALVDISPDIQAAAQRVSELASRLPSLGQTRKSAAAYEKMLGGVQQLTPIELRGLITDIDAAIGTFKAISQKDEVAVETLAELNRFRKSIADTLKVKVPEYRQAAERFENFRQIFDQLVSRDKPRDITNVFYGNVNKGDEKLYGSLLDMVQNVQRDDASAQTARTSFVNFMDTLKDFETKEASRMAADPNLEKVLPSTESIRKFLLNASDDSVLRGSSRATTQGRALVPDLKEAIIGKAPTSGAYYAGRISKKAEPVLANTAKIGKAIYNAPAQTLSNLASRLETSGQFENLGKALRESLETGNSAKKNAALFTIMQNPNARLFIDAKDLESEDETE